MAANSDLNSPIGSIMNDVLTGFNQSCTSADPVVAQANDGRKRVLARKGDTQNGVKLTFQLPKSLAIRLKRVAEKVPTTLSDFGLISVHFLGERTIQLANREALSLEPQDIRANTDAACSTESITENGDTGSCRSLPSSAAVAEEKCVALAGEEASLMCSPQDAVRFVTPLGVSSTSSPLSANSTCSQTDGTVTRCTGSLPSATTAVSVALVTTNGLKLRVRTAPIATPSPSDTEPPSIVSASAVPQSLTLVTQADRERPTLNGTHRHAEAEASTNASRLQREVSSTTDSHGQNGTGSVDTPEGEDSRFTMLPRSDVFITAVSPRVTIVRPKRVREDYDNDAPLIDKRFAVSAPGGASPIASTVSHTNHHHHHHHTATTLGVNGVLQNGHSNASKCERDPSTQNGLLLRNSKPLNGVRCGVAPRTVQTISSASATASDSR